MSAIHTCTVSEKVVCVALDCSFVSYRKARQSGFLVSRQVVINKGCGGWLFVIIHITIIAKSRIFFT